MPDLIEQVSLPTGCSLIDLPLRGDERGSLVPIEGNDAVPFPIARVYTVFGTRPGVRRGFHAHHRLNQFALAVAGGCTMILDDGHRRAKVRLDSPSRGVVIPPMVWHEMEDFTADCVLLVLADGAYDEADYIRDEARFRALIGGRSQ